MRAVFLLGPRKIEVSEAPEPQLEDGEVLARVEAVGVCGSEIEAFTGSNTKRRPPLILGHEMSVTIGDSQQRYAVNPLRPCSRCEHCERGDTNLCEDRRLMSLHRAGGMAEFVAVRPTELLPLPETVSAAAVATVEPAATALHALDIPGGVRGKRVLIVGCGSLGLLAVQIAIAEGASEVTACDIVPARRAIAASYGAKAVSEVGPLDTSHVVLDMVGSHATRRIAISSCQPGGYVRLVGLLALESLVPVVEVISRGLHLEGVYAYRTSHLERVVRLMAERKLDVSGMITEKRLDEAVEVFETLASDPGKWVKVVMYP
jgi:2-desacetyl-2-hydroxyethyl bacteriochlorophyllide A dehydrogenase